MEQIEIAEIANFDMEDHVEQKEQWELSMTY